MKLKFYHTVRRKIIAGIFSCLTGLSVFCTQVSNAQDALVVQVPDKKTILFSWVLAYTASRISKQCALWESHAFLPLEKDGLMYTAAMLVLKHMNNAMVRTFVAKPVTDQSTYIQKFMSMPTRFIIPAAEEAKNAIIPALYKEYENAKGTGTQIALTATDRASIAWYNAGAGFLTSWECFGLLQDAFAEWSKKHSREQDSSWLDHYSNAAQEDWQTLIWGLVSFTVSFIGNWTGLEIGKAGTRLMVKNGMTLFQTNAQVPLHNYVPVFKFSDTVISYFIAQFIKYHAFNALRATQDYFGGYQQENDRFWDLMYRAADKGPLGFFCLLNTYRAFQQFRNPVTANA